MPNRSLTHLRVTPSRRGERAVSPPAPLFKRDAAKRIDCHIDYFGSELAPAGASRALGLTAERP